MPRARYLVAPLLVAALSSLASAQESASRAELLTRMLEEGWGVQRQAREAADTYRQRLSALATDDAEAEFAHALVLTKQRRFADAAAVLQPLATQADTPVAALQMLIWLEVVQGRYDAALARIAPLAERVTGDQTLPGLEADEALLFLGRIVGFLEGPAASQVAAASVDRQARRVLEILEPRQVRLFEQGQADVTEQYAEFIAGSAASRQQAEEAEAQQRAAALDELAQGRMEIADRLAVLRNEQAQSAEAADEAIANLEEEAVPVQQDLAALEGAAVLPRRRIADISFEIQRVESLLPDLPNGPERDAAIRRLDRLAWLRAGYYDDLRQLDAQAEVLEIQLALLGERRARVLADLQRELAAIDDEVGDLQGSLQRMERQQQRLDRPARADTREARGLEARATSLSTYDELPLETLKAEFLAELQSDGS